MTGDPANLGPGSLFAGRYVLQLQVAAGPLSVVHFARRTDTGRRVAIKCLRVGRLTDADVSRSFRSECLVASGLRHRNTVQLLDYGVTERIPYLVMEAVLGSNLGGTIKTGGRLPPERIVRIIKQVLDSLEEAHNLGVLHRDIKPTNIMLAQHPLEEDFVKVLDFGTATTVGAAASTPLAGTPLYMAPELTQGTSASVASDLYSLGCVAFELAVGRPPFEGETAVETMMMHAKEPFPPLPSDLHSPALSEFIQWTTQKDPDSRLKDTRTARLTLIGERQFATLPPPMFHRFGRMPAVPLKAGQPVPPLAIDRRDDSNRLLRAVVEALDSAQPTFVFLTGVSGSGVSRLARDVLRLDAIQRRAEVKSTGCWPSRTSDGRPLDRAFARPTDKRPLSKLEVAGRLWDHAVGKPSILFLDEIHLADELTLGILERWLHKGRGIPQNLTVVGTVRVGDPRTNRGFDQFCSRLVGRWAKNLRVISIHNPTVARMGDLVAEAFGTSDQAKQILWNLTRGHLHYLTQLYHHCHQDRSARMAVATITKTTGARGPELRLPNSFRDLLTRRLASTRTESPGLHYTLLALAVLGGNGRLTKLDEMTRALPAEEEGLFSLDDVSDYVELGSTLGLLVTDGEGEDMRVRLAADALFEVIVSSMIDSGQWQPGNLKAARSSLDTEQSDFGQLSTSAFHALIGGNVAEECRRLIETSLAAQSGGDLEHAGQLLELAHLRAEAAELSHQERLQIVLLLAEIKRTSGVWGAAQDLFERALEYLQSDDDSEQRLRLRLDLADVMISRGDLLNAREQLSSALSAAAELERFDLEGETSFHLGKLETEAGNTEQAQNLFQHARLLLSQQTNRDWLLKIDIALADSLLETGQNGLALQSLSKVEETAISKLGGKIEASFLHTRAKLALRSKNYSEAKRDLRAAVKLRQDGGEGRQLGRLIMDLAWTYFREGSYQRAARSAASAARTFAIIDYASGESAARALLIRASYQSRNFGDVIEGAEEALRLSEFVDNAVEWASTTHFACRAALRTGSPEAALGHAEGLLEHIDQHGLTRLLAAATLDLAESLFCSRRYEESRTHLSNESAGLGERPWANDAAFLRLRLAIVDRPAAIESAAASVLLCLESVDHYAGLEGRLLLALAKELGWNGCPADNSNRIKQLLSQLNVEAQITLDYLLGTNLPEQLRHACSAVLKGL